jgi:hypothetical protein
MRQHRTQNSIQLFNAETADVGHVEPTAAYT